MRYSTILLLIIGLVFFSACEDDSFSSTVDVEIPEHESRLVASANFSNEQEVLQVLVSRSESITTAEQFEFLEDASVQLFKDNDLFQTLDYNTFSNRYEAALDAPLAIDGASYRLEVSHADLAPINALQQMPLAIPVVENIDYVQDGTAVYGESADEITFDIVDEAGVENYYQFDVFIEYGGSGYPYRERIFTGTNDPLIEGDNLINDASFDGQAYQVRLSVENYYFFAPSGEDSKLIILAKNLTKDNYLFQRSFDQYLIADDNPFAEPVVVYDNIEDGYGIFRMEAVEAYEKAF